jgi:hypothetical protein
LHDGGVDGGGIEWAKGHYYVTIFLKIWSVKGRFLLIGPENGDLVVSGFRVEANEEQAASFAVVKTVESIVASGNWVQERLGDSV